MSTVKSSYYILGKRTSDGYSFKAFNAPTGQQTFCVFTEGVKATYFKNQGKHHDLNVLQTAYQDLQKLLKDLYHRGVSHVAMNPTKNYFTLVELPRFIMEHSIYILLYRKVSEKEVVFAQVKPEEEVHSLEKKDGPVTLLVFTSQSKAETYKSLFPNPEEWRFMAFGFKDFVHFLTENLEKSDGARAVVLDPGQVLLRPISISSAIEIISDPQNALKENPLSET